jgi:hypothetical protein
MRGGGRWRSGGGGEQGASCGVNGGLRPVSVAPTVHCKGEWGVRCGGEESADRWAGTGWGPTVRERERDRPPSGTVKKKKLAIENQMWIEMNLPQIHIPLLQKYGIKYEVVGFDPQKKFPYWNFSKFTFPCSKNLE